MKLGPDLQVKLERLKVYKCDRCPKVFPSLSDLANHLSYHYQQFLSHVVSAHVVVERAKLFKCDDCHKGFSTNSEMLLHKIQHIQEKVRNQRKLSKIQTNTDILKPYKCPDCDYTFVAESTLEAHSVVHLPFPHICDCGIGYYKQQDLKNHIKLVHGTNCEEQEDKKDILFTNILSKQKQANIPRSKVPKIKREIVTKKKKGKKSVKNTWKVKLTDKNSDTKPIRPKMFSAPNPDINVRKTNDNKYECPVCKKTFNALQYVYVHYRIHSGERPYSCHLCEKSFTQWPVLNNHIQTHSTERNYVCKHCPKAFTTAFYRDRHEIIHSAIKPYECPYCNKGFHDMSALARHKRTHTGEKRYKCPSCPMAFTDVSGYHRHKLIHGKAGRFECDICLKIFSHAHLLRYHRKLMHNNSEHKFCCDYCKQMFNRKSYLVLHMRCHTIAKKRKKCKKCHKKFFSLQRHIEQVHENVNFKSYDHIECDVCSKMFTSKASFSKHYFSTHSGVRCDKCSRYFAGNTHLQDHKLLESVQCAICDDKFFCQNTLQNHVRKFHMKGRSVKSEE